VDGLAAFRIRPWIVLEDAIKPSSSLLHRPIRIEGQRIRSEDAGAFVVARRKQLDRSRGRHNTGILQLLHHGAERIASGNHILTTPNRHSYDVHTA
jgi:hypothetical protein